MRMKFSSLNIIFSEFSYNFSVHYVSIILIKGDIKFLLQNIKVYDQELHQHNCVIIMFYYNTIS
jgi:hypothetical protein